MICGMNIDEYINKIKEFHGFVAPGLLIGGYMVDLAKELIDEVEFDAIVETSHCLPDAIQILTPCTIGNGWLKIVEWDKFALTLYNRFSYDGYRVWIDLAKTKFHPHIYNWYMRLVSKKDLPKEILVDAIINAEKSILSSMPVKVSNLNKRNKKGDINICLQCGEAYSLNQGEKCLFCQGSAYYKIV
ncbi:MAG: formylmethanofuran dehydrogenase subunit E family protein [Desulfobacterales bacterium]|nr:formylmethanofuran dehydrogenase subunit E family protein [Desulfobacterales bacterium]